MRIFFIGTVQFSRLMLETVLSCSKAEVVGVATKSKSDFNNDHSDLSDIAISANIPWKYVKNINSPNIVKWIAQTNPEVIFCFGWSSLISAELLSIPSIGVIGYHPAKLPQNRGRHPIIWALTLGLRETGSTFFKMDEGADSGDILSQKLLNISEKDDAQSLYNKLQKIASKQVAEFTPQLIKGDARWLKQNNKLANVWRKRGVADGFIDFRMSSIMIYNLVRGLARPYVGAHLLFQGKEIKVWKAEIGEMAPENYEPGKVLQIGAHKEILVKSGDSSIWLKEHELKEIPIINDYIR